MEIRIERTRWGSDAAEKMRERRREEVSITRAQRMPLVFRHNNGNDMLSWKGRLAYNVRSESPEGIRPQSPDSGKAAGRVYDRGQ